MTGDFPGAAIERETKLELSRDDYERIRSVGEPVRTTRQLNVYYGDAARGDGRALLRIRLVPGREPLVTVKRSIERHGGYREAVEYEAAFSPVRGSSRPLEIDVRDDLPPGPSECVASLGVARLRRLGWMRNLRHIIDIAGTEFELDRTTLPGGAISHEIEFENADPETHAAAVALIRSVAPAARPCGTSKAQRFTRALELRGAGPDREE